MSVNPAEPAIAPVPQSVEGGQPAPAGNQSALFKKAEGNWEKANESYFNAVNKLTEVSTAAQQLAQRNQQLETMVSGVMNGGQPAVNDPLAAIRDELGLPIEPMRAGIRGEVQAALEDMLRPMLTQQQAEESLAAEIEDFDQWKGEARKYMKANPDVAETFNAIVGTKPAQAWKYAIRETLISRGGRPPGAPSIANVGLPGAYGSSGTSEPNPEGVPDQVKMDAALKYAHEFGDNAPYRNERFKGTSVSRAVADALRHAGYNLPPGSTPQGW